MTRGPVRYTYTWHSGVPDAIRSMPRTWGKWDQLRSLLGELRTARAEEALCYQVPNKAEAELAKTAAKAWAAKNNLSARKSEGQLLSVYTAPNGEDSWHVWLAIDEKQ